MPVLFPPTPWQDLTNGRFVHKPTTVVAGHSRDTPVRPSTLRTTDAPRTHPPSGQSVLARPPPPPPRAPHPPPNRTIGSPAAPPPHCGGTAPTRPKAFWACR